MIRGGCPICGDGSVGSSNPAWIWLREYRIASLKRHMSAAIAHSAIAQFWELEERGATLNRGCAQLHTGAHAVLLIVLDGHTWGKKRARIPDGAAVQFRPFPRSITMSI